jgi:hypothetical protein
MKPVIPGEVAYKPIAEIKTHRNPDNSYDNRIGEGT